MISRKGSNVRTGRSSDFGDSRFYSTSEVLNGGCGVPGHGQAEKVPKIGLLYELVDTVLWFQLWYLSIVTS